MPAAKTKSELLTVTAKEYVKMTSLIAPLDAAQAALGENGVSIKDVIAHRAHWITLFLGWYADGQANKKVFFPARGYKWNELKRYNADLRAKQANMSWEEAKVFLDQTYSDLLAFMDGHNDDALYGGPMKGANNAWTPGRWSEAAGPSHFRSATQYIRKTLKQAQE